MPAAGQEGSDLNPWGRSMKRLPMLLAASLINLIASPASAGDAQAQSTSEEVQVLVAQGHDDTASPSAPAKNRDSTATAGDFPASVFSPSATLTLQVHGRALSGDLDRGPLGFGSAATASLAFADHSSDDGHSGHDDGAHMGPMWIMMGVMMVGMMVVAGAYMMRGHSATSFQPATFGSPHQAAIPPAVAFRLGG